MNNDSTIGITLTKDEVRAFLILSHVVGGDPKKTLRGAIDSIREKVAPGIDKWEYDPQTRDAFWKKYDIRTRDSGLMDCAYYVGENSNVYFEG